ncbi:hypothetical protein OJJOAM_001664 [Cupriavidus sp. H18C1]
MVEEILRGAEHRVGIAHVGRIEAGGIGIGQGGDERAQCIVAAADQAENRALPRIFARQGLADSARCAGEKDFDGSHRAAEEGERRSGGTKRKEARRSAARRPCFGGDGGARCHHSFLSRTWVTR